MVLTRLSHALTSHRAAVVQVAASVVLVPLVVVTPPADGTFLLLPVTGEPAAAVAVAAGALVVAAGPTSNSLVVRGSLGALAKPLLLRGIIPLGVPSALCGKTPA